MQISKRTTVLLFVASFAVLAAVASPLVAAYVAAFLALAFVLGLMGYSAFVALRNWQQNLPIRHRHTAPKSAEPIERRAA